MADAATFYEDRAAGLRPRFLAAAEDALQGAVERPSAGTPLTNGRRQVFL